jgi:hypothetical protein
VIDKGERVVGQQADLGLGEAAGKTLKAVSAGKGFNFGEAFSQLSCDFGNAGVAQWFGCVLSNFIVPSRKCKCSSCLRANELNRFGSSRLGDGLRNYRAVRLIIGATGSRHGRRGQQKIGETG